MARVIAIEERPGAMPTEVFFSAVGKIGADPGLVSHLRDAVPDTTDDIGR